ncbi:iron(III) transport system permease protein [Naumannella cuiyingiana]|uniref:Iron(III) transport system permease protein n=1 Tax=Naumannella cuiyingiana TaxID=1347891 RepID=A0A7Z0D732_9ACTN|nr:iron ABC transporter permease [Naumannella cuiyingiana]NYI70048.1 iron(III) transport system permease protein [Naumannella cuiyingiana]
MSTLTRSLRMLPVGAQFALLVVLVVIPMGLIGLAAISAETPRPGALFGGLSVDNFAILATPAALGALANSVFVAACASVLAMIIGGVLAFLAARSDAPARGLIYFAGISPMFLPSLVGALAWSLLAGPAMGYLNVAARAIGLPNLVDIYSYGGLIFVLAVYYAPYAFLLIHGAMSLMNPDLEDAAGVHGGSPRATLRHVTFPLVLPAILGSAVLVFTLTMENFPVAQMIGTPGQIETLPAFIYRLMNAAPARGTEAAAVAVALTAVLIIVTAVQQRIVMRRRFTTVSGKGVKPRRFAIGRWRFAGLGFAIAYLVLALILPLLALLLASLQSSPYVAELSQLARPGALSFWSLGQTITDPQFLRSLGNSVAVGVLVAAIGTAFAFWLGYSVYRTELPGRRVLEQLAMAPLAVPAIVMGLGLLWTWLVAPVPVYGTLVVLVIAFLSIYLPQGYRGATAAIQQVDADLEDSAVLSGARRLRAIGWVTVPLLRTGLLSTALLLLMLAMRELSAALFLFTSDTRLLSIAVFDEYDNGALRAAASTSLLYCLAVVIMVGLLRFAGARTASGPSSDQGRS